jgi:hypothetical protein
MISKAKRAFAKAFQRRQDHHGGTIQTALVDLGQNHSYNPLALTPVQNAVKGRVVFLVLVV